MSENKKNAVKKVKIKLPKIKGEADEVFVSVNNYTCIIKRGEEVEVPLFVKAVLDHQEKMQERIEQFEAGASRG
jgi:hypothetical protein